MQLNFYLVIALTIALSILIMSSLERTPLTAILDFFFSKRKSKIAVNGVISKLHIKKTYDHVNWGFLLTILEKLSSN